MRRMLVVIIAFVVLVAVGLYLTFAHDLTAARARLAGRSQIVETGYGALEYASIGKGDPVLVVHGAAGGFDQGLDMAGALAGRGFRLIAPSRFGYLRSARPDRLTTQMQADAYVQLLDRLGVDKVAVVGISAGAWSALQFAIRHPERCRALVLLVPADYLPVGTAIRGGALTDAMFKSDFVAWAAVKTMLVAPSAMTQTMLGTDAAVVGGATPREKARVREILDHLLPVGPRAPGMQFDVATASVRQPYAIDRISCPVLAISAADDRFGTAARAREIAAAAPDGRTVIFPTGGHALVGRFDEALRESASFLKGVQP